MDKWFSEVEFYERVVMAKARTCRTLSDDDLDRMVGWSIFADKSWAHNDGLGSLYAEAIGSSTALESKSSPSFRLLSAIVNNPFLPSDALHKGQFHLAVLFPLQSLFL